VPVAFNSGEFMYRQLLVPLDGSLEAERALHVAEAIVRRGGARLHLVLVEPDPLLITRTGSAPVQDPALDKALAADARRYLGSITAASRETTGADVTSTLLHGDVADSICEETRRVNADLVLVTPHGAGACVTSLGRIPRRLIRNSDIPLLICRASPSLEPGQADAVYRRILVPLDEFSECHTLLSHAVVLGGHDGVEYTLLTVVATLVALMRPEAAPHTGSTRDVDERGAPQFEPLASLLRSQGYAATARATVLDRPKRAILRFARQIGADLIVMNSHGRRGIQRALRGSVAASIAARAEASVLVVNVRTPVKDRSTVPFSSDETVVVP
jgi:nucleotide-binding universal stress UspA family protein